MRSGNAMVGQGQVREAEPLPASMNTRGTELVALTHAAFGVCTAIGMLWKESVIFTSAGKT